MWVADRLAKLKKGVGTPKWQRPSYYPHQNGVDHSGTQTTVVHCVCRQVFVQCERVYVEVSMGKDKGNQEEGHIKQGPRSWLSTM